VSTTSDFGLNATYVEALKAQWKQDPQSVSEEWRVYFSQNSSITLSGPAAVPAGQSPQTGADKKGSSGRDDDRKVKNQFAELVGPDDVLEPIRGIASKIAENMEASLAVPTATSTRTVPVKVLEENRRIINRHLLDAAYSKSSFTHIVAWALVRAIQEVPSMNNGYVANDGQPTKIRRAGVHLGLAIDVPGRDGTRSLVVPNLKNAEKLNFREFCDGYNDLVRRARKGKLGLDDFLGTTVSLTNPGGLGTAASHPRLMAGQGTIIAMGSIGYPAEYEATAPEIMSSLGIGKVMALTSTYDHRVIQGAESGAFLKYVHELLNGEHSFYESIFLDLGIPHHPHRLLTDRRIGTRTLGDAYSDTERAMKVGQLIHAFRVRGYLLANVDPLDLNPRDHPELNIEEYGLTIWDLDRPFLTLGVLPTETAPFREILESLRDAYCRQMGVEYMYMNDPQERGWIQKRVELQRDTFETREKRSILQKLYQAQLFERFLHKRYMGHKRFSVEGAETLIPMLDQGLASAASHGVTDMIIGMPHRGRLNVLANIMGKSYEAIFAEFEDVDAKTSQGSGDVKYHLGARGIYRWQGKTNDFGVFEERDVRVELACNPSHLEAVNPVVLGQARARQDLVGDRERTKVVPVILHGDAAFSCQGVVYECLQMSALQGFRVGGAIHIIVNNQIGYTTGPEKARSSTNASDIARAIAAPVFRVNGDDPESCVRAMRMAFDYRMRFKKDVVIDMVCYRRYGHNEGDEPSFTQPILYKAIGSHEPVREQYSSLLLRRKDLSEENVSNIENETFRALEKAFGAIQEQGSDAVPESGPHRPGKYDGDAEKDPITAVDMDTLIRIGQKITYDPETIEIHPRVRKHILDKRKRSFLNPEDPARLDVDFGLAEILAYGSLLLEGVPVRMSGQDCGRGTFAHRHAVMHDINDGKPYIPLNYLDKTRDEGEEEWHPSRFRIYDSPLSEEAVLGFEYGYSVAHPDALVLWEAQFGDFFNGAQIQVDQFLTSGEAKWAQKSRVTMLLPHGYDGQGPEHSSARVERFLQQCAEENMRVAICSNTAQMFHLVRRQAKQAKKPLILFTHKSLLRSEAAASPLEDFATGTFQPILVDSVENDETVDRLVFCCGKIYWDLKLEQEKRRAENPEIGKNICFVRVEQLYPFPQSAVQKLLQRFPAARRMWVQEEPRNMGAFDFMYLVFHRMREELGFVGRPESASPATGSARRHKAQQMAICNAIFGKKEDDGDRQTSES
jgi:multifunctional 2-oxoglutarate metabolism enzyme